MNKRIKNLWVRALRSGDYEQGIGKLRRQTSDSGERFCCLGVLCNLHAIEHPKIAAQQKKADRYMGEVAFLPPAVMRWAGLRLRDPAINPRSVLTRTASDCNDSGHSFKQIANLIERNL